MKKVYLLLLYCIVTISYAQDGLSPILIVEKVKGQKTAAWLIEGLPKDATILDLKKAFEPKSTIAVADQHFMGSSNKILPDDMLVSKAVPTLKNNSFSYPFIVLLRKLKE